MRLLQPLIDGGGKGFQYPKPFTPLHKGRGEPRSGEGEGLWVRGFGVFFCPLYYILSGTSMPSSAMPFLMVFATFWASTRRTAFSSALSAPRIE